MATLKEIKGRIGSVKSTLKITTAMKMVASAKLHKAQTAIEGMLPYEQSLKRTLDELLRQARLQSDLSQGRPPRRVTLLCVASNSSLCGSFNANAIREARLRLDALKREGVEEVTVLSVGRKMAEAMRKEGYPSPEDFTELSAKPSYEAAAVLSDALVADFREGRTDREIAAVFGVSRAIIQRWRDALELPSTVTFPWINTQAWRLTRHGRDYIVLPPAMVYKLERAGSEVRALEIRVQPGIFGKKV